MREVPRAHYDPALVAAFYDAFGGREWDRLGSTAKGRLLLELQMRFVSRHLPSNARVLDAGCGAGRIGIELAQRGARVTLLDISPGQLAIAKEKVAAAGVGDRIDACVQADICDLASLPQAAFDLTICLGTALDYVLDTAVGALRELAGVTKPGGRMVLGVASLWGCIRYATGNQGVGFVGQAERYAIWEVVRTGTIPAGASRHPPRHIFTSGELAALVESAGCRVLEIAGVPCLGTGVNERLEEIAAEPAAWSTLVDLEEKASEVPGAANLAENILLAAEVPRTRGGRAPSRGRSP